MYDWPFSISIVLFPPPHLNELYTSALDASGVDTAFQRILTEIYRLMSRRNVAAESDTNQPGLSAGQTISLSQGGTDKKKGCCSA